MFDIVAMFDGRFLKIESRAHHVQQSTGHLYCYYQGVGFGVWCHRRQNDVVVFDGYKVWFAKLLSEEYLDGGYQMSGLADSCSNGLAMAQGRAILLNIMVRCI